MLDIQGEIEKALAPEIQRHVVELSSRREGLVISLREIGFFESGSATLRSSSQDAIDRLATILRNRDEMLRIEGHTDNVPIHNAQFHSNWELSTARATELIEMFITAIIFRRRGWPPPATRNITPWIPTARRRARPTTAAWISWC